MSRKILADSPSEEMARIRAYKREYYQKHRDKIRETAAKWRKDHLEYTKEYARKYWEARRRSAGIPVKKKKVLNLDTGEVYDSISECSQKLGVSAAAISQAVRHGYKVKGNCIQLLENDSEEN